MGRRLFPWFVYIALTSACAVERREVDPGVGGEEAREEALAPTAPATASDARNANGAVDPRGRAAAWPKESFAPPVSPSAACKSEGGKIYPAIGLSAGKYMVPVAPTLAYAATNVVDAISLRVDAQGRYHLEYTLPRVLAGCAKHVDLVGVQNDEGELVLSGSAGSATCNRGTDGIMTCHEHLSGVVVDIAQVRHALDERGIVGEAREDYLSVAHHFSIDPLGVLTFADPR